MRELLCSLKELVPDCEILEQEPMSRHTTFRIGGPAELYIAPKADQIAGVVGLCRQFGVPCFVMGNGSNLLVGDLGIPGVVLEIGKQAGDITVDGTHITAQAGAFLASIAAAAAKQGLTGLEFASGIPGSLGGALVMNAGAYGGEMKQVVKEVTCLTPEGEEVVLTGEQMEFGYRHSIIPEKGYIVLSAVLSLHTGDREQIQETMRRLNAQRAEKQPLQYPSAGSTFKRPEGYYAGKLIMDAGLSGYSVGGAQVSEKHCGFVINAKDATAQDVVQLMEDVRRIVKEKFGVELVPEVRMAGRFQ
ncbi:MAG: UDP-N-acetylmuramate dehydrogenase [Lachnospiraceae bacterium]